MSQIRARIRAEIFGALNDSPPSRPDLSNENLIINELIREYLRFNGYEHTLGVFLPESGQPNSPPFDRSYITKQLKVVEDKKSQELPLLYGLAFGNKKPRIRANQLKVKPSILLIIASLSIGQFYQ